MLVSNCERTEFSALFCYSFVHSKGEIMKGEGHHYILDIIFNNENFLKDEGGIQTFLLMCLRK